ncbi:Uncharacterised protein [Streptococcus pneumoniae]|nr:Uncharacterised protein [Streptococcus pneumoniae]CGF90828.1 Uncharacterised protein [Streptococcus pneumoniae]CJA50920.1 Uncharacterised protein [Streptococcus pneumoniae]CJA70191.1 Uncharacterised protein [Streptococcus pneumoniae]CJA74829.1 Uncharacterised protein [Streptococcus pneumoniae]
MGSEPIKQKQPQQKVHTYILKERTDAFKNMPLEETLKWMVKFSYHMASEIDFLKQFESEYTKEVGELLSEETIQRYKGLALSLQLPYTNYKAHADTGTLEMLEQGLLVQSWSSLGSLLESTLQMFLAFYYRFYKDSNWNTWNEESIKQIEEKLMGEFKDSLEQIVKDNAAKGKKGLTNPIKKSFLSKAKYILKQKEKLPSIEKITLSDLLDFYFSEDIIKDGEYTKEDLQKVRDYRNAIHTFQKRIIGTWDEFNDYLKYVILLIIEILYRLPDPNPEVTFPEWYVTGKSQLIMQEKVWFNYRLAVNLDLK